MLTSPLKMSRQDSRESVSRLLLLAALLGLAAAAARAQVGGGTESTGTGGNHVIQGRIFLPSGRISDMSLRVKLESMGSGALSVYTDGNGAFKFTSLMAGSYTVVVEATDQFEQARESVYIDQQTSRAFRDNTPRVYTVYVYLRPKRPEGAEPHPPGVVSASLAGVPKPAADLYGKALEAARNNKPEKAVGLLKTALETYPDFRLALSELGAQYLKLKQPERAAEALRAALKLAPEDYPTLLSYGIALYDLKQFDEAEVHFRKAAQRNSSSTTAHFYLGMLMLRRRELEEAERELRSAASPGGGEIAMAHYYLGGLYWELKQYKRAADELETYLKRAPSAPDAARLRATIQQLRAK